MKAEEFERQFDDDVEITGWLDLSNIKRDLVTLSTIMISTTVILENHA